MSNHVRFRPGLNFRNPRLGEWPVDIPVSALLYALLLRFRTGAIKATYVQGLRVFASD